MRSAKSTLTNHINKLGDNMKTEEIKDILESKLELFGYGDLIHEDTFCKLFSIEKVGNADFIELTKGCSKDEVKDLLNSETLTELAISEVVKTELRKLGRHMVKSGKVYRVCLPSENEQIALKYKRKAARANNKAKQLISNTPKDACMQFASCSPFAA